MDNINQHARIILSGGILSLAVSQGISRFVYTPLLPSMQRAVGFNDDFAGYLASANFGGYLAGSIWAAITSDHERPIRRMRWNLAVTMVCTLAMGLVSNPSYWLGFRFLAGFASAMVFILVSGLILDDLIRCDRQAWFGWLYAGIGLGISVSALTVPVLVTYLNWQSGWIGITAISLLLLMGSSGHSTQAQAGGPIKNVVHGKAVQKTNFEKFLPWLVASYCFVGLGYIVTGTFLVSVVERTSDSVATGAFVWLLVGLAAIPSCPFWTMIGQKVGWVKTLMIAQTIQAIGIILPLILPNHTGAFSGAICFGGTFLGIAALTIAIGRRANPEKANRNTAILTAAFGVGQMVGPTLAGKLAVYTDGFAMPLYGAAMAVVAANMLLLAGRVKSSNDTCKSGAGDMKGE